MRFCTTYMQKDGKIKRFSRLFMCLCCLFFNEFRILKCGNNGLCVKRCGEVMSVIYNQNVPHQWTYRNNSYGHQYTIDHYGFICAGI